jgi:phosphate starvation-inducible PhoH-like protein
MKAYIDAVLNPTGEEKETPWVEDKDVLLFGNKGLVIKVKTPNQRKLVEAAAKNDIVFAIGPAGTGKTYTAVALAVKALKNKEVKILLFDDYLRVTNNEKEGNQSLDKFFGKK